MGKKTVFKIVTSHVTTLRRKNFARTREREDITSLQRRTNSCSIYRTESTRRMLYY